MNISKTVYEAEARIRPHIRETILEYSPYFSRFDNPDQPNNVYFKCENLQHTGSFKVRGALNKILALYESDPDGHEGGIVTASTGNHGAATAFALQKLNKSGIVFVPENASPTKVEAIQRWGAEVHHFGADPVQAEQQARDYAQSNKLTYISPYNDLHVLSGQGTIGIELQRQFDQSQLGQIDTVFVATGGGGLISGIAGYLKAALPHVQIIGCSPENSQVMIQSVQAGEILDLPSLPTLSDGTSGGVEADSITFGPCCEFVDRYVTVTEQEIADSLRTFMATHHMMIEGAAAMTLAAYRKERHMFTNQNVVIVLCGANIGLDTLKEVL